MFTFCNFRLYLLVVNMHFFTLHFPTYFLTTIFFRHSLSAFFGNIFQWIFFIYYCYAQPQLWFVNNNCTKNTFFILLLCAREPTDSLVLLVYALKTPLAYFIFHHACMHRSHKIYDNYLFVPKFFIASRTKAGKR
jgi:hypothetical protein